MGCRRLGQWASSYVLRHHSSEVPLPSMIERHVPAHRAWRDRRLLGINQHALVDDTGGAFLVGNRPLCNIIASFQEGRFGGVSGLAGQLSP